MTTEEDMLRLMTQVRHLEEANAHKTGRVNQLAADLASTKANLESLRWSIIAACSGTKCLNAHELRFNLDEARQNVKILAAEVRAWRAWFMEEMDVNVIKPIMYQAVIKAIAATDAAKAMEEKCGS